MPRNRPADARADVAQLVEHFTRKVVAPSDWRLLAVSKGAPDGGLSACTTPRRETGEPPIARLSAAACARGAHELGSRAVAVAPPKRIGVVRGLRFRARFRSSHRRQPGRPGLQAATGVGSRRRDVLHPRLVGHERVGLEQPNVGGVNRVALRAYLDALRQRVRGHGAPPPGLRMKPAHAPAAHEPWREHGGWCFGSGTWFPCSSF